MFAFPYKYNKQLKILFKIKRELFKKGRNSITIKNYGNKLNVT